MFALPRSGERVSVEMESWTAALDAIQNGGAARGKLSFISCSGPKKVISETVATLAMP